MDCFFKIYKEVGLKGFYWGVGMLFVWNLSIRVMFLFKVFIYVNIFLVLLFYGIFLYAGLKFYFYEEMKRYVFEEYKKDIMVKLVCGFVAGLLG